MQSTIKEASSGFALIDTGTRPRACCEETSQCRHRLMFLPRTWCAGILPSLCLRCTDANLVFDAWIQVKVCDLEATLLNLTGPLDVRRKSNVTFSSSGIVARMPTVRDVSNIMRIIHHTVPKYNLAQVRQRSLLWITLPADHILPITSV